MATARKTWKLASFAGGIDRRDGQFTDNQNRFRDLVNYRVGNAKKLIRRPPLIKATGSFGEQTQGLIELRGALYVIAKKGDPLDTTITAPAVTTLRFDNPDYCSSWTLVQAIVYNGTIVALIRHAFASNAVTSTVRLHIFDDAADKPTYVEDPYCPTNFVGGMLSSSRTRTYDATWNPFMVVAQGHLWIAGPDGNVYFSKTANPRAWNQKQLTDLTDLGQEWAFVVPDTPPVVKSFVISEPYEDFAQPTGTYLLRYSAYLLEFQADDGSWVPMVEVVGDPVSDRTFSITSQVSRFNVSKTELVLRLFWNDSGGVPVRFRAIIKGRSAVVSGDVVSYDDTIPKIDVASGSHSIDKDGTVTTYNTASFTSNPSTLNVPLWVLADDSGAASPTATNSVVTVATSFPTGYQRWKNHLLRYCKRSLAGTDEDSAIALDVVWQGSRKVTLALYAGAGDAGFLATAAQPVASSVVTALAAVKNRLIVFYKFGLELWAVGATSTSHALIDIGAIGTGTQDSPQPAKVLSTIMVGTARGIRAFSLDGLNLDTMRDQNVGEPIVDLGTPLQQAACYWSYLGEYITAAVVNGVFQFLAFDYSPESKVAAWSRWTPVGISGVNVGELVPLDSRLYFRTGVDLYYFDASATSYRDSNDPVGVGLAYESKATWHFNDFQKPGLPKQVFQADLVQIGQCTIAFQFVPHDATQETVAVPVEGTTYATGGVPVATWGPGIAPVIRSTDETGHELQEIALGFITRDR